MGSTMYDPGKYAARMAHHTKTGTDPMAHTAAISSGAVAAGVHDLLNVKNKNKAGLIIREALDTDAHPTSLAIAVIFDVTGSMGSVPRILQKKMIELMATLVKKGVVPHPHILFAAAGDANSDQGPIQVGQYEAGNEADEALANIWIEGNGGGQKCETYELAMYFLAKYSKLDCLDKRGHKGYMIVIGDEMPYSALKKDQVKEHIGDTLESDILFSTMDPRIGAVKRAKEHGATGDLISMIEEKFELIWIMPNADGCHYFNDSEINETLKTMLGERFHKMENPEDVCEFIAGLIAIGEGYDADTVAANLLDAGASKASVGRVMSSLVPYAKSRAVTKKAEVTGELATVGADGVDRI